MVFVTARPEALAAAASQLQAVSATLEAHRAATASAMTTVLPAAADEVSLSNAAKFAAHAQNFQALSAQAAEMHEAFVATMQTSAESYGATEAANAAAAR